MHSGQPHLPRGNIDLIKQGYKIVSNNLTLSIVLFGENLPDIVFFCTLNYNGYFISNIKCLQWLCLPWGWDSVSGSIMHASDSDRHLNLYFTVTF